MARKKFWEADSARQRDRFAVVDSYERNDERRKDYRNGYYERDFVTVLGTIRLRIARTRGREDGASCQPGWNSFNDEWRGYRC